MPDSHTAAQSSLSFAKLVATPTDTAWSQVFNTGNLFACVTLTLVEPTEDLSLQVIGRDLFTELQSKFHTLQQEDTTSIKEVLQTSFAKLPPEVSGCLSLAFFKDTALHVFIAGSGRIVMKREEKIGILLERQTESLAITSASGYLKSGDTVVLETGPFAQSIDHEIVKEALELTLPTDIVEALSPPMHEKNHGGQAAIVIVYRGAFQPERMIAEEVVASPETPITPEEQTVGGLYDEQAYQEGMSEHIEEHAPKRSFSLPKLPHINFSFRMSHRRKLFLNIALILLLLLGASVFLTLKKKSDDQKQVLFQQIYPQAKQDYETGQGLETLNPTLSQENYHKAEALLKDGETKFSKGSNEYKQMDSLLSQVASALGGGAKEKTTATKEVKPDKNSLLQVAQNNDDGLAFGEDSDVVYMITAKAISTISKTSGDQKDIIKNDNDWSSPKAVVPYQGNVYVLDSKKGVIKFVQGSGGFGNSSYFKSNAPDLSQGSGMAVDGSIWLVAKTGSVWKYTKGVSDDLKLSGLQKPLNNPTKIVTDISMEHFYILDQGNSRIVQFSKSGAYQNAYIAPVVATATDFTVSEKNKTMQVLSGGKVWQMSL